MSSPSAGTQAQDGKKKGGRNRRKQSKPERGPETQHASKLFPGQQLNILVWTARFLPDAFLEFKNLARCLEDDAYWTPAEVKIGDYEVLMDDGAVAWADDGQWDFREAKKERNKQVARMLEDRPALFAMMLTRLSDASFVLVKIEPPQRYNNDGDAIAGNHPDGWLLANEQKCPLALWLIIKRCHASQGRTTIDALRTADTRLAYQQLQQSGFETLAAFHDREQFVYDGMVANGNPEIAPGARVLDYLRALSNSKHSEFKTTLVNGMAVGSITAPETVNELHTMVSNFVGGSGKSQIPNSAHIHGSVFAVTGNQRNNPRFARADADLKREDKREVTCYRCQKPGHVAKDCRHVFILTGYNAHCFHTGQFGKWYQVLLDNQSDVSVCDPRLVDNIANTDRWVYLNGISASTDEIVIKQSGNLAGIIDVYASDAVSANVLCMADLEDKYDITYLKGVSYTVHTPEGDLLFKREGKHYVCNMLNFLKRKESHAYVTTISERKSQYSNRQVTMADKANDLWLACDSPGYREFLLLVRNLKDTDISTADIDRAADIYGLHPAALAGKTTAWKPKPLIVDRSLKLQVTHQSMYVDVLQVGKNYLMFSVTMPLGLAQVGELSSNKPEEYGVLVQGQVSQVVARGFIVDTIFADPHSSMQCLVGNFPGIEVSNTGALDHLPPLDIRMRHCKEIARTRYHMLPFRTPDKWLVYLVYYSVSRYNMRGSKHNNPSGLCPLTMFTGRSPSAKCEYSLSFGDYVSVPAGKMSNRITDSRTVQCIALYWTYAPTQTWIFLDLRTNRLIRRSTWRKLHMPDTVIALINGMNGTQPPLRDIFGDDPNRVQMPPIEDEGSVLPTPIMRHDPTVFTGQFRSSDSGTVQPDNVNENENENEDMESENETENETENEIITDTPVHDDDTMNTPVEEDRDVEREQSPTERPVNKPGKAAKPIRPALDDSTRGIPIADMLRLIAEENLYRSGLNGGPAAILDPLMNREGPGTIDSIADTVNRAVTHEPVVRKSGRLAARRAALCTWKDTISSKNAAYVFTTMLTQDMKGAGLDRMSLNKGLKLCGDQAVSAAVDEMVQLFQTKLALRPVLRQDISKKSLRKIIKSSMFFKAKFDASGNFEKLKARLVAWGNLQDRSDYPDRAAPTVGMQNLRSCLVIAAREGRNARVYDIGGAFLTCEMTGEDIVIEVDPILSAIISKKLPHLVPYLSNNGKIYCTLDKALYGLVQSAKLWYDKLIGVLESMGYVRNPVDPCVLNKTVSSVQCTLLIHVDDILALSVSNDMLDDLEAGLIKAFDEVKIKVAVKGEKLSYLGMELCFDDLRITITMGGYVEVMLKEFGEVKCYNSPAVGNVFEINEKSPVLEAAALKVFHTNVAKLLYYTMRVKVAISTVVSFLCTRVTCATEQDMWKLRRAMGYVKYTGDTGIVLLGTGDLVVRGFVDAAFGSHADGKSHTGLVIMLGDACVEAKSSKQKICTKDSTEAELVAASDKVPNIVRCHDFLVEQGVKLPTPLLMQDNQSAIHMMTYGSGQSRSKHLRVRKFGIKELLDDKSLRVAYAPTGVMKADILTKALQGNLFRFHLNAIDNVEEKP